MVMITHLVAPATIPNAPDSLSVISYNVLLPNSVDAWWTYKMYSPPLTEANRHIADWPYRRGILKDRIGLVNADVVCLQEVSPESFEDDFSFMKDLGYDGCELFRKGRFRPATFWKGSKCTLASPAAHKDRTLLTAFTLGEGDEAQEAWFVLNCHLQAGNEGKRRFRQIQEGTKAILTMANKLKVKDPASSVKSIICGDFNGGAECGAVRFIEDGFINAEFLEDGEQVTSTRKALPMTSPFQDAMSCDGHIPHPTMVVPELISQMVEKGGNGYENPVLSSGVVERLVRIFNDRATQQSGNQKVMCRKDVEQWLMNINGRLGRGDEYREAARQMGWKPPQQPDGMTSEELKKIISLPSEGILSLEGFIAVYQKELVGGKFWGINYDLSMLGEPLANLGLFAARYDRMYCSAALKPIATMDFQSDKSCPNNDEPSDHLPVVACFVSR